MSKQHHCKEETRASAHSPNLTMTNENCSGQSVALCLSCSQRWKQKTHDDGRVPGCVLRHDDTVALLLPLRRLVLHVGDSDRQLYRGAPVPAVCRYDIPGDVGSL